MIWIGARWRRRGRGRLGSSSTDEDRRGPSSTCMCVMVGRPSGPNARVVVGVHMGWLTGWEGPRVVAGEPEHVQGGRTVLRESCDQICCAVGCPWTEVSNLGNPGTEHVGQRRDRRGTEIRGFRGTRTLASAAPPLDRPLDVESWSRPFVLSWPQYSSAGAAADGQGNAGTRRSRDSPHRLCRRLGASPRKPEALVDEASSSVSLLRRSIRPPSVSV